MGQVTWGQNTVHTFGASAAAPTNGFGFGAGNAAAPTTGLFGAPASPATPGATGLFGAPTAAPTPGTSLFGNTTSQVQGGLFGSTAPSPSSSLFGAAQPATGGFFGASAPAFGAPAPANAMVPQQQIPAQAALMAHMDASARQESARVLSALEDLYESYAGSSTPKEKKEFKFSTIIYNELTPEQRQFQWIQGIGGGGSTAVAPPRPAQVSEENWKKAVVRNPDPQTYMPSALVGAEALQARISWQQDRVNQLAKNASTIQSTHNMVRERCNQGKCLLEQINRAHATQRKKLLDVMRKVEIVRSMNLNLQADEGRAMQRLMALESRVAELKPILCDLQDRAGTQSIRPMQTSELPDKTKLFQILKGHREELTDLTSKVQKDFRDVGLIRKRVA